MRFSSWFTSSRKLCTTEHPVVAVGLPTYTFVKRIAVSSSVMAGSVMVGSIKNVSWQTAQIPCTELRTRVAAKLS